MSYYYYFECLVVTLGFLILQHLIINPLIMVFKLIRLLHQTCNWYTANGIRPWQAKKALALYVEQAESLRKKSK